MHDLRNRTRRTRAATLVIAVATWALLGAAAAQGAEIYENQCASCHGPSGAGGGPFPALAGSEIVLGDPHEMVALPLQGAGAMPSFAGTLSDAQIADVATYVRTSWGNDAEPVDADLVAEVREELGADPGPEPEEPAEGADGDEASEAEGEAEDAAKEDDADAQDDADRQDDADVQDDADAQDETDVDWDAEMGAQVYGANCSACHGTDGQGIPGAFPPLAGNAFVRADAPFVIHVPMYGRAGMPSFSGLSNEELAAVVSHIRTAWGNDAGPVTVEQVEAVREDPVEFDPDDPNYRPGAAN